jgi:hypothetical protein
VKASQQPPGYVVLYRGERPPGCDNVDRATPPITRGRWFTTSLEYAQAHLSPNTLANHLRGIFAIPFTQQPLKHPEVYGDDARWRIKGIVIPEEAARLFFCRNVFTRVDDRRALFRRVEYPLARRRKLNWRKQLCGRRRRPGQGTMIWLPPADLVAKATVLKKAATVRSGIGPRSIYGAESSAKTRRNNQVATDSPRARS